MPSFPRHTGRSLRALMLVLFAAVATFAAAPAASATTKTTSAKKASKSKKTSAKRPVAVNAKRLKRSQRLLALRASGTHDKATRASVARFQGLRGIPEHGVVDMVTYREINASFLLLTARDTPPSVSASRSGGGITVSTPVITFALPEGLAPITEIERRILSTISKCESGDNPRIVSRNRLYRGLYQFSLATWKTVGGTGDPAKASSEEQDQRAAILLRRQGTAPWPTCGRRAA